MEERDLLNFLANQYIEAQQAIEGHDFEHDMYWRGRVSATVAIMQCIGLKPNDFPAIRRFWAMSRQRLNRECGRIG